MGPVHYFFRIAERYLSGHKPFDPNIIIYLITVFCLSVIQLPVKIISSRSFLIKGPIVGIGGVGGYLGAMLAHAYFIFMAAEENG